MKSPTSQWTMRAALFCLLLVPPATYSQEAGGQGEPLTKEEFSRFLEEYRQFKADYASVKTENQSLRADLERVKAELAGLKVEAPPTHTGMVAAAERAALLREIRDEFGRAIEPILPGSTNFAIGGAALAVYQDRQDADSTFGFGMAPILLWMPTDRLLFETEIGLSLAGDETEVELGLAQFSYIVNDHVTLGAGLFRLPFATFWERWHPSWINKLPTIPLIYERGFIDPAGLGVQVRGGAALGSTKVNYALYFINGPKFRTSQVSAGRLGFSNFRDNNNNKGLGARFGFLPIPELEFGYSFFTGRTGDSGGEFHGVDTVMHGIDFAYAREFDAIKGRLDLRAEAVWIDTDDVIFTGAFNPFTFDNQRNGWFVQVAYRPTKIDYKLSDNVNIKNFEFAVRYGQTREQGAGNLGIDRGRLTVSLDYWLLPNAVLKAGYARDEVSADRDQDAVFLQMAVGF